MDHLIELEAVKAEADAKLELLQDELQTISAELSDLQNECRLKTKELIEFKAEATASDQKARIDAAAKEETIQRLSEDNAAKAQRVLQLEQDLITLRNELADESKKKIQNLRTQMSRSHAEEIDLLKSRHESHVREAADLAMEQEQLAVDNAVARIKLEYEAKLSHQLDECTKDLESIKAKLTDEINSLRQERDGLQLVADMVPSLNQSIEYRIETERKLEEVVSSKQNDIIDLESRNQQLHHDVEMAREALHDLQTRSKALEDEVNAGKDHINSLESQLSSVKQSSSEELERTTQQSRDKDLVIARLETSLSQSESTATALNEQVGAMKGEMLELNKFKQFVECSASTIADLNVDVASCKHDTHELTQLFSSSLEELGLHLERKDVLHSKEVSKLEEGANILRDELSRLLSEVDESERSNADLIKKIARMETAARDAEVAISEERSSWEQSLKRMEVSMSDERLSWEKTKAAMKAAYEKEQATLCCQSQDEQDILNNRIVLLQEEMKKQQERSDCHHEILKAESARQVDALNATMSKIKYEAAAEIQELENVKSTLTSSLEEKERECNSLSLQIESITQRSRAETEILRQSHKEEVQTLSSEHKVELEGQWRAHEERVASLEAEIENLSGAIQDLKDEKERYTSHVRTQLTSGRATILDAIVEVRKEVDLLRTLSTDHVVKSKQHLGKLIQSLKQRYDARLKEYSDEISRLEQSHSEAFTALKQKSHQRFSLAQKELRDAKQILFQTVQEGETKLDRTVRRLEEEHQIQLKAAAKKKSTDLVDALSKLKSLTKECQALGKKHAMTTDEMAQRDEKIALHTEEITNLKQEHKKERRRILRDSLAKETAMSDQFAKERADLKANLLAAKEENLRIHEKYKAKGEVHEQIKMLQKQIHLMEISEKEAKDKLLRMQQQMEAEKKRQNESNAALRTIQSKRSPSKLRGGSSTSSLKSSSSRRSDNMSLLLPSSRMNGKKPGRSISKSLR
jgi:predicted RNase H-like nuclease (RuvC/YqgF family)